MRLDRHSRGAVAIALAVAMALATAMAPAGGCAVQKLLHAPATLSLAAELPAGDTCVSQAFVPTDQGASLTSFKVSHFQPAAGGAVLPPRGVAQNRCSTSPPAPSVRSETKAVLRI